MGEWVNYRLGDIADVRWGDTGTTKAAYTAAGFPAYSASGRDGFLPTADYHQTGIVLSAIGAQCGRTWLAKGDWSCIKNTIRILASDPRADIEYLYWYMQGNFSWPLRGSAQPFISQGDAQDVVVVLPNISYQRAIARLLGALDDKIAVNERIMDIAEKTISSLYSAYLQRGNVSNVPLSEVVDFDFGLPFSSKSFNESRLGMPLLRIRDLKTYEPKIWTTERLDRDTVVLPGDVVAGMDAEFRPRIWLGDPALLNQRVLRGRAKNRSGLAFVKEVLTVPLREIERHKTGTTVIHLNKSDLNASRVDVPDADSLLRFDTEAEPLRLRLVAAAQENRALTELRDALLPKLMSGQLRVRDAERLVEDAT